MKPPLLPGHFSFDNPGEETLIKIYIQIPYEGSEFEPPGQRAGQASETLFQDASLELNAFQHLREASCESTPALIGFRQDKQDEDSLVPGAISII
jgi:hypothetical protein